VAFARGDTIQFTVTIKFYNGGPLPPPDPNYQLYWAGFGPDGIRTGIVNQGRPTGDFTVTMALPAQSPLPNSVRAYPTFGVSWKCIWATSWPPLDSADWRVFGESLDPLYVTYGRPQSPAYHSLIYNATMSADGLSTWQDVLNADWTAYTTNSIAWKEPKPYDENHPTIPTFFAHLFYYGNWGTLETWYTTLLSNGDGQCFAWVNFWINELKVQGITEVTPTILKIQPPLGETGFLINNWTFIGAGTSGDPTHPYMASFLNDGNGDPTPRRSSNTESC
jgi:hypothetical protein